MKFPSPYKARPIRFLEVHSHQGWLVKIYSISAHHEFVSPENVREAKENLTEWLAKSQLNNLETYQIANLIIHEAREGCFAVINWWIDDNMLQHFVYFKNQSTTFQPYSNQGVVTCVWELAVLWFERNAWVKHILENNQHPNFQAYLAEQLNQDV
jgi:hypothetical protein